VRAFIARVTFLLLHFPSSPFLSNCLPPPFHLVGLYERLRSPYSIHRPDMRCQTTLSCKRPATATTTSSSLVVHSHS
jgi:hypothetical protein